MATRCTKTRGGSPRALNPPVCPKTVGQLHNGVTGKYKAVLQWTKIPEPRAKKAATPRAKKATSSRAGKAPASPRARAPPKVKVDKVVKVPRTTKAVSPKRLPAPKSTRDYWREVHSMILGGLTETQLKGLLRDAKKLQDDWPDNDTYDELLDEIIAMLPNIKPNTNQRHRLELSNLVLEILEFLPSAPRGLPEDAGHTAKEVYDTLSIIMHDVDRDGFDADLATIAALLAEIGDRAEHILGRSPAATAVAKAATKATDLAEMMDGAKDPDPRHVKFIVEYIEKMRSHFKPE